MYLVTYKDRCEVSLDTQRLKLQNAIYTIILVNSQLLSTVYSELSLFQLQNKIYTSVVVNSQLRFTVYTALSLFLTVCLHFITQILGLLSLLSFISPLLSAANGG
jgi:hypothetical protein